MKGTGIGKRRLGVALVAALGVVAMLALPSFAAAKARGHHHHARRHHLMGRHGSRKVLIRGSASNTAGSPMEQENAGEVESFDGTTLTIKLFAGGTVSGKVTESTEIECEGQSQSGEDQGSEDSQEGGENGTENSGDQSQQSGDQQSSDQQSGDEAEASDTEDQAGSGSTGSCGTASLTPGAIVHEAELEVGPKGAVFHSVHLAG